MDYRSMWNALVIVNIFVAMAISPVTTQFRKYCYGGCDLPDCYCAYEDIPGKIPERDTPQMVLFSYSGALTKKVRTKITEIFPDKIVNPNDCPVGITLFVVSQNTDDCGLHKLYIRGHEIALSGINRTTQAESWGVPEWSSAIIGQFDKIVDKSNVNPEDISGMQAQKQFVGGDAQFEMLKDGGFLYDSSMLAGPTSSPLNQDKPHYWPYTLDKNLKELEIKCSNRICPEKNYTGLWEVPVSSLIGTRGGKERACTFLDDCISDYKKASEVTDLLKKHFKFNYRGNRAPMQVHFQARSLETSDIAVEGMKDFISYLMTMPDTWIVTTQELLTWVRNPTPQSVIMERGFWDCPMRDYVKCTEKDGNSTLKRVTFREIIDVEKIWIWQLCVLAILFVVIKRYDMYKQERKKK